MHMYPLANVTRPHSMHAIDVAFGYRSTDRMAWQAYTLVWLWQWDLQGWPDRLQCHFRRSIVARVPLAHPSPQPKCISIGSSILVGLMVVTQQIHRPRYICSNRPHLDMRCSLISTIHTHTHTQPFNSPSSGTTRVSRYQKKPLSTHTREEKKDSHRQQGPLCGRSSLLQWGLLDQIKPASTKVGWLIGSN